MLQFPLFLCTNLMDCQREEFESFCKERYGGDSQLGTAPKSKTITKEKGERIIQALKQEDSDICPKFKHWVRSRKFQLLSYPPLGLKDVLCLPAKSQV